MPTVTIDPPVSGVQAEATAVFQRSSGTIVNNFKSFKIFEFNLFGGQKTRTVTNATITQYTNGTESNGVLNVSLPPPV